MHTVCLLKAVVGKLRVSVKENTEVSLYLSASYWFEEISITQDTTANLQYCFTSLFLRLEKIAAGYMQIDSTGGSSQLPAHTRQRSTSDIFFLSVL